MIVKMELEQATYHVAETRALQLKEVRFKLDGKMKERKRLFRTPLYELTILAEVNVQAYEFSGYDLDEKLIAQLEADS